MNRRDFFKLLGKKLGALAILKMPDSGRAVIPQALIIPLPKRKGPVELVSMDKDGFTLNWTI